MPGGTVQVRQLESSCDLVQTAKARAILQYAHDSAEALLAAFESVRRERNAERGRSTDEEQDLLRSMLVVSAAGLDAMLKQLIKDCLAHLARVEPSVADQLEKHVMRQLRGDETESESAAGNRYLAKLLVAESLRVALLDQYVLHLTGTSLQSAEELSKACNALAVDPKAVGATADKLRPIFDVRNRIIHELDIDFETGIRNRFPRSRKDMTAYSNTLLEVGEELLKAVECKLVPD